MTKDYFWNLKNATLFYTGGGVYITMGEIEKVIDQGKKEKYYFYGEFNSLMITKDYGTFTKLSDPDIVVDYDSLPIEYLDSETSLEITKDILNYKSNSKNVNNNDNFDLFECESIYNRIGE